MTVDCRAECDDVLFKLVPALIGPDFRSGWLAARGRCGFAQEQSPLGCIGFAAKGIGPLIGC